MKYTNSFKNMKNKNKGNQLFNLLSLRQKDFESPNKNIYSIFTVRQ